MVVWEMFFCYVLVFSFDGERKIHEKGGSELGREKKLCSKFVLQMAEKRPVNSKETYFVIKYVSCCSIVILKVFADLNFPRYVFFFF